jgi:hypothetical protein
MRALGTIIEWNSEQPFEDTEFYTGLLDYFDWWFEVDPRLSKHHDSLSPPAFAFGRDLVHLATYSNEILGWLSPDRIRLPPSLVVVSSMTEAFFFSVRSACDAIASVLAYAACEKPGQAPGGSLRGLIEWADKHNNRVRPDILAVLKSDLAWFWKLRRLRDQIAHGFADAGTFCDGRQFDLILMSTKEKRKAVREPLLPLLASQLKGLVNLSDEAADVVNRVIEFPLSRIKSRVVCGVLIPALHKLITVAPDYAKTPD